MPRTCKRIPFTADLGVVNQTIISILKSEGFNEKSTGGENYWRKGTGVATAMQYIKFEFNEKEVLLYGWIQVGLGSVAGKEMELKGFVGMLPKRMLLKRMNIIENAVLSLK